MTDAAQLPPTSDAGSCRWAVEVSLKFEPTELGLDIGVVGSLIRVWLAATSPEAYVVEREGTPVRYVQLPTRAQARRLVKVWGGRTIGTPTTGFTLLACRR